MNIDELTIELCRAAKDVRHMYYSYVEIGDGPEKTKKIYAETYVNGIKKPEGDAIESWEASKSDACLMTLSRLIPLILNKTIYWRVKPDFILGDKGEAVRLRIGVDE